MTRPKAPDFLVIGANRAGSSSLFHYLKDHPRVFATRTKEPCYFSDPAVRARGDDWYEGIFRDAGAEQVRGEGSTTYLRWPYQEQPWTIDPRRSILERRPDVRLLYLVRHPVDRAFSQYAFRMRHGRTMSFEEALVRMPAIVDCSRYEVQIQQWRELLPDPGQLLVLLTEDMDSRQPEFFARVQRHIGVEPVDLLAGGEKRINPIGTHHMASFALQRVRRAPLLRQLFDLVPARMRRAGLHLLARSPLGRRWRAASVVEPMLPETRARLLRELLPAVEAIERETGRQLPHWRQ